MTRTSAQTIEKAGTAKDTRASCRLKKMHKVLCVAHEDVLSGPMSKYIAKQQFELAEPGCKIDISSAGLVESQGEPISKRALKSLKSFSAAVDEHKSRYVGDLDLTAFDTIICTTPVVRDYVKTRVDTSVQVILIEGLGDLGVLVARDGGERSHTSIDEAGGALSRFYKNLARTHLEVTTVTD